jgi:hypothetical protein
LADLSRPEKKIVAGDGGQRKEKPTTIFILPCRRCWTARARGKFRRALASSFFRNGATRCDLPVDSDLFENREKTARRLLISAGGIFIILI